MAFSCNILSRPFTKSEFSDHFKERKTSKTGRLSFVVLLFKLTVIFEWDEMLEGEHEHKSNFYFYCVYFKEIHDLFL